MQLHWSNRVVVIAAVAFPSYLLLDPLDCIQQANKFQCSDKDMHRTY